MGNGNIPYFFRIRKIAVGLPLAGNGNIPYFFRIRKFAVGLPLAGNGNTPYGAPRSYNPNCIIVTGDWFGFTFYINYNRI